MKNSINEVFSFYRDEKRLFHKGEAPQIKKHINEIPFFEDKKLLRKNLNYKPKKVDIKRKKFQNNIIIIIYIIIINSFSLLLPLIESKFSNITLKIKGPGFKYILSIDAEERYYPNITYINGKQNFTRSNNYYFDKENNDVELIWYEAFSDCNGMFSLCNDIMEIDFSNFDTSKVKEMCSMFDGCSQLSSINFANFNTSNVESMDYMFSDCSQLSSLNLSNFDTSKVTSMMGMFYGCIQLSSLNLFNFDTSKVVYMYYMFSNCSRLSYLNLKNFIENDSLEVTDIFAEVPDNIVVCLNENSNIIFNEIQKKKFYSIDCSDNASQKNIKKTAKEEIEYYDKFIQKIEDIFTSTNFNTTKLDEGEDEIYEKEKVTITLTTSKNQKNNLNDNLSRIDLADCEKKLIKFYNLTYNEIIYIKKIDIFQEGMRIPKIEYDVYCKLYGENLSKLNITICKDDEIYLYMPTKNIVNLEQLNKSSDYYNDICSNATSDSGTDIIHKDRQNEYIYKTVCQDDCDFNHYNETSQKAKCSCKVKESSSSFFYMNIDRKKLINNFKHVYNLANLNLLVCVKKLFSVVGIIKNVGSYIMIFIIVIHIIDLFIFFIIQLKQLNKKIQDIIYAVKNYKLIKANNKNKDEEPKKKEIKSKHIGKKINKKGKRKKKMNKFIKNKNSAYIDINNHNIINNIRKNNNFNKKRYKKFSTNILTEDNSKSENKAIIKKVNNTMQYINDEINILPYNLSLQYDTRTFCEYYISLLKIKHHIIFSFYYKDDYNARIIKIDYFFVGFSIYYTVNALFFNDNTMHNIYENEGSFDIEYRLT